MSERSFSRILDENARDKYRQELIGNIEDQLEEIYDGSVGLTTYIVTGGTPLTPDDTKGFEDMLRDVGDCDYLFLMIDSPGGDAETALRTIRLYRQTCEEFKTIVPDMAKSAATQICLGSNEILMGRNSELGPIDPLIRYRNQSVRAKSILNAMENLAVWEEKWDWSGAALNAIASNFDPHLIQQAEDSVEYIEERATEISIGMIDEDVEDPDSRAEQIVNELMEARTHGRSINIEEADEIGLNVRDLRDGDTSGLWDNIWEYYLRTNAYVREDIDSPAKVLDTCNETLVYIN